MTGSIRQTGQRSRPDAPSDAAQQGQQNVHDANTDTPVRDSQRDVLASLRRQSDQDAVSVGDDAPLEEGYGGNPVRSRENQERFEQNPRLQEERRSRNASDAEDE